MSKLKIVERGDHHIVFTRQFRALPEVIYDAHTQPDIIQRWMRGPDGWQMLECQCDARPGGRFRYVWQNAEGQSFSITGEFLEMDRPNRILHVERMHMPNPTPDNRIETAFVADGSGTLMTLRMSLPDAAAMTAMLETGMEEGMEHSFGQLDEVTSID
ncbi:SRPBCC domain-containing protein [Halovulum sp. GXIMD14793]